MNEVVGAHDDKIKIAKASDKFANHPHVSLVAFAVQTIYARDARGNRSPMVKSNMPPVDKIRQSPVRAFWKVGQGIKSLNPITMEIWHFRKIE